MKKRISFLSILFSLFFLSVVISAAETVAVSSSMLIVTPFAVSLELTAEPPDNQGTDVANIFTLNINFANPRAANQTPYTILYFVDDRLLEEFTSQALPFSLRRNYKGLREGTHTIKIQIEDSQKNIMAKNTLDLTVHHAKQK